MGAAVSIEREAILLDEDVEQGHGEGQAQREIAPDTVGGFLTMTDLRKHGNWRTSWRRSRRHRLPCPRTTPCCGIGSDGWGDRQALQETPPQGQEHAHRSAEEIRASVLERYPVINLVTVYRTLELFEERGLVDRVTLGDKLVRWAQATHAHHHLVCRECGGAVELATEPFRRLADDLERSYGVRVDIRHLALRGLCPLCAAPRHDPRAEARQVVPVGPRR